MNTGGVPLTVFELVTATFATYQDPATHEGFDLRKDWEKCKSTIRAEGDSLRTDLFDGIDETAFLTSVTLYTSYLDKQAGIVGAVSCKKKDVLGLKFESYLKNRDFLHINADIVSVYMFRITFIRNMEEMYRKALS